MVNIDKHDHGATAEGMFDLVVLAPGQRPPAGSQALAELTGVELNQGEFPTKSCVGFRFAQPNLRPFHVFPGGPKGHEQLLCKRLFHNPHCC